VTVPFVNMMLLGGKSVAAPVFVASTQIRVSTVTSGATVTCPAGVIAGDFLVAIAIRPASGGAWAASGWTKATEVSASHNVAILRRVAGPSEPSAYTFTNSTGTTATILILAYRGVSSVTADNLAAATFAAADPQVAASMTIVSNRILLAVLELNNATVTLISGPSGMTSRAEQFTDGTPRAAVFDAVNAGNGASGVKSFDISASIFGTAFLIELG
jgi:hypothetical protein